MGREARRRRRRLGLAIVLVAAAGVAALMLAAGLDRGPNAPGGTPGADPATPSGSSPPATVGQPSARPTARGALRVGTGGWQTDFEVASVDLSEVISGGPGKDGIPSIDEPRFESMAEARRWLGDQAPVIALELGGEARAYPLAIMTWHEIVNDTVGGVPAVITFCPLCNTALVFERRVGDAVHDFGTTGNLRYSDLVMYDRQTESWWQQATGEAIVGQLTGSKLTFVAAQIVSLAAFEASNPGGLVLSRETGYSRSYGTNPYVGYDRIDQNPFLFRGVVDGRLAPMERVAAVSLGGATRAYPFSELAGVGVVHDEVGGHEIVVFWQPGVASALDAARIDEGRDVGATGIFRREVDGRRLTFELAAGGSIVDRETNSSWSVTGLATDGSLAGQRLEPVSHGNHFWFAWAAFEPQTTIWTAEAGEGD